MVQDELVASAAFQPEPMAAAAARHFVRATLREWLVPAASADAHELVDDAVLLTSELVTNAVVHAGTPVQVTCRLGSTWVEVMVSDSHPGRLVPDSAHGERRAAEQTGGRGLLLPAALAAEWGVTYGRTAKAVWFRLCLAGSGAGLGLAGGNGTGRYGELDAAVAASNTRVKAGSSAATGQARSSGNPGYRVLLASTVEAARVTVRADAAFAFMPDEDGDLRLQAAAGTIPSPQPRPGSAGAGESGTSSPAAVRASTGAAASVVTVPFVVDGRVTGLLAAAPGRFSEAETAKLQRLADTWGGPLQRAWLFELDRVRRGRVAAVVAASGLLRGGLGPEEVLSTAGHAVVPGLAAWCAVLTWSGNGGMRTVYARHRDSSRTAALTWLLDRTGETAHAASSWLAKGRAPGRRWPLPVPCVTGAPATAGEFAADVAWSFPLGHPDAAAGVFVIGGGEDRLAREVAALAADIAIRVGLALSGSRLVGKR